MSVVAACSLQCSTGGMQSQGSAESKVVWLEQAICGAGSIDTLHAAGKTQQNRMLSHLGGADVEFDAEA